MTNSVARQLRITDVEVLVTNPMQVALGNYVLVKLTTNDPNIYGWGDATCSGSELGIAKFLEEHLTPALIGRDPMQTEKASLSEREVSSGVW